MNILKLAIVDPNDATREDLAKLVANLDDLIWLDGECAVYDEFCDLVRENRPAVAMVCLDADPNHALDTIKQLRRETPGCDVLAVSSCADGPTILRAMRAGAKEFLPSPVSADDLINALEALTQNDNRQGTHRGMKIAVVGAAGGVGTTSVAVNIASVLADDPANSVVLVDLDLALGDADVLLDSTPEYTLSDVAENMARLDFDLLRRSLTKLDSGLFLLPRPVDLAEGSMVTAETIRRILSLLNASFTHVVVDLSKAFNELDIVALELADEVLLVSQLNLPCLRNVVRLMKSFSHLNEVADKVKVVVNRVGLENAPIRIKKAEGSIGREIFWQLPNDYPLMVEVCNNGVPLIRQAPKAEITQSFIEMTASLCGQPLLKDKKSAPDRIESSPKFGRLLTFWSNSMSK